MVPLEELLVDTFKNFLSAQSNIMRELSLNLNDPVKIQILGEPSIYDWLKDISPIALGIFSLFVAYQSLSTQRELTKTQIRASIKEKWVQDFRSDISQFILSTSIVNDISKTGMELFQRISTVVQQMNSKSIDSENKEKLQASFKDLNNKEQENYKEFRNKIEESALCNFKIQLFLRPEKKTHSDLIYALHEWSNLSDSWIKIIDQSLQQGQNTDLSPSFEKLNLMREKIVKLSQLIIDEETDNISR